MPKIFIEGFDLILHVELAINAGKVLFHGLPADAKLRGYFLIEQSPGYLIHDLLFPETEQFPGSYLWMGLVKMAQQPAVYEGGHGRSPCSQGVQCLHNEVRMGIFEQVPVGPGPQGTENGFVIFMHGQYQVLDAAHLGAHFAQDIHPVGPVKGNIQYGNIHGMLPESCQGLFSHPVGAADPESAKGFQVTFEDQCKISIVFNDSNVQHDIKEWV